MRKPLTNKNKIECEISTNTCPGPTSHRASSKDIPIILELCTGSGVVIILYQINQHLCPYVTSKLLKSLKFCDCSNPIPPIE